MLENLTAEQLLNFDFGGGDWKVMALNLLAFLAGVILNSFREMKKHNIGFMDYWTKAGLNSMTSLGALVATFVSMMTMAPEAPLYAFFSMAFMGDALLNKPPAPEVADRGLKDDLMNKVEEHPMKAVGVAVLFVVLVVLAL